MPSTIRRVAATGLFLLSCAPPLFAQTAPVVRVPITGTVEMGLAPFVERSLEEAEAAGASAVVLDINTPGGRVDAAERITDAVEASSVPVYAFVNPRAFSAGALIALSTERVYMGPGAVIGAATPVDGSGARASEKIVSAMRSQMRGLAERRGLDPRVAEAMVDESLAVEGVVEEGRLLTLTTEEAAAVGYAVAVEDWEGVLEAVGVADAPVRDQRVNWAERIVRFFSHPVVAPFLLTLGFLGILAEIKAPGVGLAGLAGVVSLSLFFGSHLIVGLAGMEDLLLFAGGWVLIAIEVFVIPGFGVFGLAGAAGILGGLYMSQIGDLPTRADLASAGAVVATSILVLIVTAWAILRHLPRSERLFGSRVFLRGSTSKELGYASAPPRRDLVGRTGRALTDLRPSGTGLFGDERVDVVSESSWIEEGSEIEIVRSESYRHVVRTVPGREAPSA